MARQRDFQTNAQRRAGQGGGNRLTAFVGLGVHSCAFDLAQDGVHPHQPLKEPLGRIIARLFLHPRNHVEVHATGERAFLAGRDHHALHGVIGQRVIDKAFQQWPGFHSHDIHRLARGVPGNHGDAIGAFFHCEISHLFSPWSGRVRRVQ